MNPNCNHLVLGAPRAARPRGIAFGMAKRSGGLRAPI